MKAIVFDWDGTLVDTLPAITRANAAVLESYGLPFDPDAYRAAYSPDWQEMYVRLGVERRLIAEAGARWLDAYAAEMDGVRPMPRAEEALGRLSDAGLAMGLVTAGDRAVVEDQLHTTGLGRFLPVRVCGEDLPVMKPHPAPLRTALAALGLADAPERTAYIGDAQDDMRMARTVGARGVGVVSMLGTREDLVAAGASDVVESVADWVDAFLAAR
ncbi:MAG TPA: HAD family hydrolase [Candidatus Limnocylindrales bacterium]|jgi:HAD superfamily hydrolase (TIGR01509 family)